MVHSSSTVAKGMQHPLGEWCTNRTSLCRFLGCCHLSHRKAEEGPVLLKYLWVYISSVKRKKTSLKRCGTGMRFVEPYKKNTFNKQRLFQYLYKKLLARTLNILQILMYLVFCYLVEDTVCVSASHTGEGCRQTSCVSVKKVLS